MAYQGKLNITTRGLDCLRWNDTRVINWDNKYNPDYDKNVIEEGLLVHNYCRNPDDDPTGHWCFVDGAEGFTLNYCSGLCCGVFSLHSSIQGFLF